MRYLFNTLMACAAVLALYIPASTQEAAELWPSDNPARAERVAQEREQMDVNVYSWTSADRTDYPDCRKADGEPALGDTFLVVDAWTGGAGTRSIESYDRVVQMSHENDTDEYPALRWNVIGYCS